MFKKSTVLGLAVMLAVSHFGLTSVAEGSPESQPRLTAKPHVMETATLPNLSLGKRHLPEIRKSTHVTTGVTHTEIVRGYESHKAFYTVEMGFFDTGREARKLRKALRKSGYKAKVLPVRDRGFKDTDVREKFIGYAVQVGEYSSERAANAMAEKIRNSGFAVSRVVYSEYDGTRKSTGPWRVHVLEIDPDQFSGRLQPGIARDQIEGNEPLSTVAVRHRALAAVNGGYFVISSRDGTPGDLAGISVLDGKLISESVGERTSLILEENRASIAEVGTTLTLEVEKGNSRVVDGINRSPGLIRSCGGVDDVPSELPMHDMTCTDDDEIIQFNAAYGDKTPPGDGYEVVLDGEGVVTRTNEGRGSDIPEFGTVLSATGDAADWLRQNAAVGERVILTHDLYVEGELTPISPGLNIVNGGPRLLENGQKTILAEKEGFSWSPEFYYNFGLYRHPRTLAGIKENGNILFVTVDGRNPGSSIGVSFHESAALLQDLGAVEAMNLDGGGSTTMVVGDEVVNTPSGSAERAIADGIFILDR